MNTLKLVGLAMLAAMIAVGGRAAESTNINPALLYYQAFTLAPNLARADGDILDSLFDSGGVITDQAGKLLEGYDATFKLVRRAAHATVPCDWGIDWSDGPETLLPALARCKVVSNRMRLRVRWELQNGRQSEACDDLLATLTLARNASRGQALIGVLVDFAMEAIVETTVAENFWRFSPESMTRLAKGFDAAPAGETLSETMAREEPSVMEHFEGKIQELRQRFPGDDAQVVAGIRKLYINGLAEDPQVGSNIWGAILTAAGGTSAGLARLATEMRQWQSHFADILALPQPQYETAVTQFAAQSQASSNPLAVAAFQPLRDVRPREFRSTALFEMVRAALAYKLSGDAGFQAVRDPFGKGPLGFERFTLNGDDRGFKLSTVYKNPSYPIVLIFIEKEGPPVVVYGLHAGQPMRSFE